MCVLSVTEMTNFLSNVAYSENISIKFSLTAPSFLVVFQFQLLTSWGDPYYIGLTGLEFFDEHGDQILLTENSIFLNLIQCSWVTSRGNAGHICKIHSNQLLKSCTSVFCIS